jgi:serine/threonine protein kinase
MEPVLSGLTLGNMYMTSQQQALPVPEELAFYIVDQISQACSFLHDKCRIVRADVNRENVMLRYPGRESKLLPDVVLIDWSLWEEASAEWIVRETEKVYECLLPVLFEGG